MNDASTQLKIVTALPIVGVLIRYSFYLVGTVVLSLIGVGLLAHKKPPPPKPAAEPPVAQTPAFRLANSEFEHKRRTTFVINLPASGRVEAWQYGQLTDRNSDLTVALFMQPHDMPMGGDVNYELGRLRAFHILQGMGPWGNSKFYDLQTRFGEIRATEMQANADGLIKLCLGFVSRFDAPTTHIAGWYCTASGQKPAAIEVACALDTIVLDSKLASEEADAFFRKGAAKPPYCSAEPVTQTTDTRPYVPRPTPR